MNTRKAKSAELQKKFAALERESQQKFSDAKAELGLWSDAGIGEGRQLFWSAFERGKVFGRRQTFWDALVSASAQRIIVSEYYMAALSKYKCRDAMIEEGKDIHESLIREVVVLYRDVQICMSSMPCHSLHGPESELSGR